MTEALLKSGQDKTPDQHFGGRTLSAVAPRSDPQTKNDVWVLSSPSGGQGNRKSTPFLQREFNESDARVLSRCRAHIPLCGLRIR